MDEVSRLMELEQDAVWSRGRIRELEKAEAKRDQQLIALAKQWHTEAREFEGGEENSAYGECADEIDEMRKKR